MSETQAHTPEPSVAELTAPPPVPTKPEPKVVKLPPRVAKGAPTKQRKVAQRGKAIGAKAAKAKAGGKAKTKFAETMKITVVAKKNPHREGSTAYQRFALFRTGMTVGAWRQKAIAAKLAKDGHGHLRVYVNAGQFKVA
jgi:hypothetical protein